MPDIMMCNASNCACSTSCYRHPESGTKPDALMQSWWLRQDDDPSGEACHNYWKRTRLVAAVHDGSHP